METGPLSRGFLSVELQMSAEELKGALPGQRGRLRLKVLALGAVEAVAGIIEEERQVRMRAADLRDFLRPNVSIFGAQVHHDGAARHLCSVCRDLSTVIAHGCGKIEPRGREPRETAAEGISQHANFQLAPFRSRMADRSRH